MLTNRNKILDLLLTFACPQRTLTTLTAPLTTRNLPAIICQELVVVEYLHNNNTFVSCEQPHTNLSMLSSWSDGLKPLTPPTA